MKISLAVVLLVFSLSVFAEADRFEIKADKTTGSRIARTLISSNVPFYKAYGELSDEEKNSVRSDYQGLSASDVPPYPVNGMRSITEALLDAHKALNKKGDLYVIAKVGDTGKVMEVKVYKSTDKQMTQMAGAVFFETEFSPGTCAGAPCETEFLLDWKLSKRGEGMNGTIYE